VAGKRIVVTKTDETGTVVTTEQRVRVWMQVIVSLVVLLSGIAILTSPNFLFAPSMDEGMKKFAAGWVGAVIGYWLY
jgi:hypothetical protein